MNGTHIIVAVDEDLQHRAQPRVGVGDPVEVVRRSMRAGRSRRLLESLVAQLCGRRPACPAASSRVASISSGIHGSRVAEHGGRAFAAKDLFAQHFAADRGR